MSIDVTGTVRAEADTVWRYFAAPGAIRRLAPPFLPLRPVSEAESLRDGEAVLVPRSAVPGPLGVRLGPAWVAAHDPAAYVEGERFVDRCTSQPYAGLTGWAHEHTVSAGPEGTTILGDHVRARMPARLLEPVFAYRYRQMDTDLDRIRRIAELSAGRPRTVAVTGASGLVGTALVALLGVAGHRVVRLVRRSPRDAGERQWNPENPAPELLDGVDVLVHLAGESIAGRFTDRHLAEVRESRVGPTRRLAGLVAERAGRTALVCASAIGVYGSDRGDTELTEDGVPGAGARDEAADGPLAGIVREWEAACGPARDAGARVVSVRTGVVLSGKGGMLPALASITRTGLGGHLGSGRQWMSWISLDDLTDIYLRAGVDGALSGPVNAVAPTPVRNSEFTDALGSVLHRPTAVPVPTWAPGVLLGRRGSQELALADQQVVPGVLEDAGHPFRFRDVRGALAHELGAEALS